MVNPTVLIPDLKSAKVSYNRIELNPTTCGKYMLPSFKVLPESASDPPKPPPVVPIPNSALPLRS